MGQRRAGRAARDANMSGGGQRAVWTVWTGMGERQAASGVQA